MRVSTEQREQLLQRFERVTAWPMLILALAIVPIIVIPLVAHLTPSQAAGLTRLDWLIWAAFAIEFAISLGIAPKKLFFLRHHVIDTIVVVVPFAQPLRLLRSARVLRATRVMRAGTYLAAMFSSLAEAVSEHSALLNLLYVR